VTDVTSRRPDAGPSDGPPTPLEIALRELERKRRDRWLVGAILMLAVVAAFAVLLIEGAAAATSPWAAVGFLAVTLFYGASVVFQEDRSRRAVRALVDEREHLAALEARVAALETLHEVVRDVVAARDLPDVFDRLLRGATQLTEAASGAVLLRVGDALTVAAADGPGAPSLGTRLPEDHGAAWEAVRSGDPQVIARGTEWGMDAAASTLAAPLHLEEDGPRSSTDGASGRIVGALVVERGADAAAFSAADRLATALFAQQAALAVRNASRLDRADERAEGLARDLEAADERAAKLTHDLVGAEERAAGLARDLEGAEERAAKLARDLDEADLACRALIDDREATNRASGVIVNELWGLASAVTGTLKLLVHRGDAFSAARRKALLDDLLEDAARQRELLARLEEQAATEHPTDRDTAGGRSHRDTAGGRSHRGSSGPPDPA
jgi:hypothetical protein